MGFKDRLVNRLGYAIDEVQPFIPETQNRAMTAPSRESFVVTESSALSLVAVSRAISVLQTAIMQIPVEVERNEEYIQGPLWLETPDVENNVSQAEWLGTTLFHMAATGNAFWLVQKGPRGIVNIKNIHPQLVSITVDGYGQPHYWINGTEYSRDTVVHIKLWENLDPYRPLGEGPIQRHRSVLRSALDLHDYADNWFRTAAVPTGTLTTSEFLSADVAKQNKDAFIASQQERSVAVLSSGLKYDSISLSPEEAQFLENQKYINRQIATMFGVPVAYLGMSVEGQGMTYVNGNEDRAKLYEDGLQQYIVRIEQAITDLLPRGQYAEFNLTEFLRPNTKLRYESYAIGLDKKFLTVEEIRAMESLPPLVPSPTADAAQQIN
jgi:HK97 family phage portal protein